MSTLALGNRNCRHALHATAAMRSVWSAHCTLRYTLHLVAAPTSVQHRSITGTRCTLQHTAHCTLHTAPGRYTLRTTGRCTLRPRPAPVVAVAHCNGAAGPSPLGCRVAAVCRTFGLSLPVVMQCLKHFADLRTTFQCTAVGTAVDEASTNIKHIGE